jgi:hypothetical protein
VYKILLKGTCKTKLSLSVFRLGILVGDYIVRKCIVHLQLTLQSLPSHSVVDHSPALGIISGHQSLWSVVHLRI